VRGEDVTKTRETLLLTVHEKSLVEFVDNEGGTDGGTPGRAGRLAKDRSKFKQEDHSSASKGGV